MILQELWCIYFDNIQFIVPPPPPTGDGGGLPREFYPHVRTWHISASATSKTGKEGWYIHYRKGVAWKWPGHRMEFTFSVRVSRSSVPAVLPRIITILKKLRMNKTYKNYRPSREWERVELGRSRHQWNSPLLLLEIIRRLPAAY